RGGGAPRGRGTPGVPVTGQRCHPAAAPSTGAASGRNFDTLRSSRMTDRRREKLLPVPRWPTRKEAMGSLLFSPIQVGPLQIRERTWVPAMVPWRATEGGFVTPEVLDWYERFARGQPGVIVLEATGLRDIAGGPLLRVGPGRYIPGLRPFTEPILPSPTR